jgi:WD40 repeat protein
VLAQSKEYVRASQTRLLLQPVAEQLVKGLGRAGAERRLRQLLAGLHLATPAAGYAATNLLHLLLYLEVDLRGTDCSGLLFRQLSLRGVSLPEVNFAGATMRDSVFTEPFGFIFTAAFSPDGRYVAAGTNEGAIYIWRNADQQLMRVIRGHHKTVGDLAFGQRVTAAGTTEVILASACADKTVGLWSLDPGATELFDLRLAHPQQQTILAVNIQADGRRLTAVDDTCQAFVWDITTPDETRLLYSFPTLPTRMRLVSFSADGATMAVGSRAGQVQLWDVATGTPGLAITVKTDTLNTIALRGDGRLLAGGDKEGRIFLWRLPEGRMHQVIETKVNVNTTLAFSPDGRLLASAHENRTICLWSLDAQGCA